MNLKKCWYFLRSEIFFICIVLVLITTYLYSFDIFHTLTEAFTIVAAIAIAAFVWNARRFLENSYFIFLGLAVFSASIFNIFHAFARVGITLSAQRVATNEAQELLFIAVSLLAISFATAPFYISRQIKGGLFFSLFIAIDGLLLYASVVFDLPSSVMMMRLFSAAIIVILFLALWHHYKKRNYFNEKVFRLLIATIWVVIFWQVFYTLNPVPDSLPNAIGHLLQVLAIYLLYKAIVVTGLSKPYDLLFNELQESRSRLEESQRLGQIGNWDWDFKSDMMWWSKENFVLFGVSLNESPTSYDEYLKFFTAASAKKFDSLVQKMFKTGKACQLDLELAHPTATTRWVSTYTEPCYRQMGEMTGLHGTVQDITLRRQAEENLKQTERTTLALLNGSPDAAFLVDAHETIRAVNKLGALRFHSEPLKMIGKNIFSFFPPDLAHSRREYEKKLYATKQSVLFNDEREGRFYENVATPIFDEAGNVISAAIFSRDVTEQKQVVAQIEAASRQREAAIQDLEKFKLAVQNASDHIIITDAEGTILFANKASEQITGFSSSELIGTKAGALWGKKMPQEFYANMWKVIKDEKKIFYGEINNKRKNGEEYIAAASVSPILDEKGDVHFFVGIERDITREKEIDRMKTEFVSLASHQLRTPLTGIKWLVELLLRNKEKNLSADQLELLHGVSVSNERMIHLVDDLLDVSHIDTGKNFILNLEKTDIVEIIKSVATMVRPFAGTRGITIRFADTLQHPLEMIVDKEKIHEVFQNLIDNAIKYSKDHSEIVVGAMPAAKEVVFYIQDHGVGIPPAEEHLVFGKFFRATNVLTVDRTGTGLGLYIVKGIVEYHGGKVWFETEQNVGTTFYFSLPLK